MDDRGRLVESVTDGATERPAAGQASAQSRARRRAHAHRTRMRGFRWSGSIFDWHVPRGAGVAAAAILLCASIAYGAVRGGHLPVIANELRDARDAVANMLGFRITSIALAGEHQVTREDILTTAGVTGRTSLLFLDAGSARAKLKTNPWIAEATVLKLYPGRLHIGVTEREALALWQKAGKVTVIAGDGTVVESFVPKRFADLPLVVGAGAEVKAKDFLALMDRYPAIRDQLRASILVADRRWNLKLKSGIDVRLPEIGIERALDTLVRLDKDKKLLSRDITAIDLRLPDRVTVRLSDAAAQAREDAKPAKPKRRGGDA